MSKGKLYKLSDSKFMGRVSYRLFPHDGVKDWEGELTLEDHIRLDDGDKLFIIELEDKRRGQCSLRRIVNRPVSGIPPRWVYHVTGYSSLQ